MHDNTSWVELARLPVANIQDVVLARLIGYNEASKMGFAHVILTRLTTAISEISRNVVQHAGCPGVIQIGQFAIGEMLGLRIIVSDKGRGLQCPHRSQEEGTLGTLGTGLAGTRLLVDHFDIQSASGSGTTVTMEFWKREITL